MYYIVPGGRRAVRVGADVKVGYTGDLEHRCKTLAERVEHAVKLEHFTSRTDAKARETYLHDRYRHERKSSDPNYEVFTIHGQLARDLADLLVVEVARPSPRLHPSCNVLLQPYEGQAFPWKVRWRSCWPGSSSVASVVAPSGCGSLAVLV